MQTQDGAYVTMDQLRVGLYVYIDLKWFEHPFAFNSFKIKDDEQIRTLRSLGIDKIRYDPARSDKSAPSTVKPAADAEPPVIPEAVTAPAPLAEHPALAAKRELIEKIRLQRESAARIEAAFVDTARTIHNVEKNLLKNPVETIEQASRLVGQIVDSFLSAPELALHVMGDKIGSEEMYFHSLNVTMLSLMMARDLKLPAEVVQCLGMGALFHDIGTREIPDRIRLKTEAWTQAERNYYELHCQYGADIARGLKFVPLAIDVIQQHHEMFDGSGYPAKLAGQAISLSARIVAIANFYDELCNPINLTNALTPHEALSTMFARLRGKFDPKLLQIFVRCLGVYPPGTIVQLSNGVIGMVATINTTKPMKPMIIVYDANIPKEDAILVDMDGAVDVNIAKAIRPSQLPREIYTYLSPRKQVSYYFDAGAPSKEGVPA